MNKSTSVKATRPITSRKGKSTRFAETSVITRSQFLGGKYIPPSDPPTVEQNPWNKTTILKVSTSMSSAWEIKISDLADYIVAQLDSPDRNKLTIFKAQSVPLDLKVKSIQAWNMTGKSIALGAYNLIAPHDNQDIICDVVDTRAEESLARVGYRWPLQMQQIVFSNNISKPSRVATIFAPATSDVLIQCLVHWKTSITPISPYNALLGIVNIQKRTSEISLNTKSTTRRLGEVLDVDKKILSWMPETTFGVVPVALAAPVTGEHASDTAMTVHPQPDTVEEKYDHTPDVLSELSNTQAEVLALREEIHSLRLRVDSATSVASSASLLN